MGWNLFQYSFFFSFSLQLLFTVASMDDGSAVSVDLEKVRQETEVKSVRRQGIFAEIKLHRRTDISVSTAMVEFTPPRTLIY